MSNQLCLVQSLIDRQNNINASSFYSLKLKIKRRVVQITLAFLILIVSSYLLSLTND
jgi:hypothetical protein